MKQFSCDKCSIPVKDSFEFWTSSIVSNTGKFVRKLTACKFDVNWMTLISCLLQLLTMGNLLYNPLILQNICFLPLLDLNTQKCQVVDLNCIR